MIMVCKPCENWPIHREGLVHQECLSRYNKARLIPLLFLNLFRSANWAAGRRRGPNARRKTSNQGNGRKTEGCPKVAMNGYLAKAELSQQGRSIEFLRRRMPYGTMSRSAYIRVDLVCEGGGGAGIFGEDRPRESDKLVFIQV